jgi:hypothetical protein
MFGTANLRRLVDGWIESGRKPDGSESPSKRDLRRATVTWEGLKIYFGTLASYELVLSEEGSPSLRFEAKSWEQLRNETWLPRARQQIRRYARELRFPVKELENPDKEIALLSIMDAVVHDFAAATLLSDLRWRIAKCRHRKCPQPYFAIRKPSTKTYANGLFCCTDHNRAATATKNMVGKRTKRKERLIERAAHAFLELGEKPNAKEKLVGVLNRMISKDPNLRTLDSVKVNWVTRHWQEIQKKAEELNHAKRQATR